MARLISFAILIAALLGVVALFIWVMAGFIFPLFLAAILVVIFRPLHMWVLVETRGMRRTSAALTTIAILLIVLAPMSLFISQAIVEAYSLARDITSREQISERLESLRGRLHLGIPGEWRGPCERVEDAFTALINLESRQNFSDADLGRARGPVEILEATAAEMVEMARRERNADAENADGKDLAGQYEAALEFQKSVSLLKATLPSGGSSEVHSPTMPIVAANPSESQDSEIQETDAGAITPSAVEGILDASSEEPAAGLTSTAPSVWDFREKLLLSRQSYDALRVTALGGPIWAVLKTWANPSKAQVVQWSHGLAAYARSLLAPLALGTSQAAFGIIVGLVILVVSLYFFLADGPAMTRAVMRLSPLDERYVRKLLEEFDQISRAVVLATILAAIAQGILGGIGYYVAGLQSVFLLTMLTMVLATIPFVGATAVWLPCSLWLILMEPDGFWAGIGLMVYGACVVSTVDNVIKPLVLHGQSSLHPLLALLSVLGGVQALGPIGILVGPMAVVFLQALLNMLNMELESMDKDHPEQAISEPAVSASRRRLLRRKAAAKTKEQADESAADGQRTPPATGETAA